MITTVIFVSTVVFMFALWLMADALIWIVPPYRRFKRLVEELEQTEVERVTTPYDGAANTLARIGRRRIPEVFLTVKPIADGVTILQCFGAFFFKDESITEIAGDLKINAFVVLAVGAIGILNVLTHHPAMGGQIMNATFWNKVPILTGALSADEWVLTAEIALVLTGFLYLVNNGRLIGRLIRSFEAK